MDGHGAAHQNVILCGISVIAIDDVNGCLFHSLNMKNVINKISNCISVNAIMTMLIFMEPEVKGFCNFGTVGNVTREGLFARQSVHFAVVSSVRRDSLFVRGRLYSGAEGLYEYAVFACRARVDEYHGVYP